MVTVLLGAHLFLSALTPMVTERAGSHDVFLGGGAAFGVRHQVLASASKMGKTSPAHSIQISNFIGAVVPHWKIAVIAKTLLKFESVCAGGFERWTFVRVRHK